MARNTHPEVTERRILEAARDLFAEQGYEKTSIQNIVDRLGDLSKGAIYHHFASKEAILDRLTSMDWDSSQGLRDRIMADTGLNGMEKLRTLLSMAMTDEDHNQLNQEAARFLNDPTTLASNLHFWASELPDHWMPILEAGIADGSIPTEYPREVAQLLALLCNYWLMPCFFPATRTQLRYRLQCLATMLDALHAPVFDQHLIDLATDGMMAFAGDGSGSAAEQQDGGGTSPVSDAH